jgi:uroporphyrinogen III methyltransferase/synthase
VKFAAIGSGTAKELLQYGFHADYIPLKYQVTALAQGLKKRINCSRDRLLIPRSRGGSKELVEILDETGAHYDDIVLYEVACNRQDREKWKKTLSSIHYLTFASASGVRAFFKEADTEIMETLSRLKVVCIGDITARALKKWGRQADIIAQVFTIEGMSEAISKDWAKERNAKE